MTRLNISICKITLHDPPGFLHIPVQSVSMPSCVTFPRSRLQLVPRLCYFPLRTYLLGREWLKYSCCSNQSVSVYVFVSVYSETINCSQTVFHRDVPLALCVLCIIASAIISTCSIYRRKMKSEFQADYSFLKDTWLNCR